MRAFEAVREIQTYIVKLLLIVSNAIWYAQILLQYSLRYRSVLKPSSPCDRLERPDRQNNLLTQVGKEVPLVAESTHRTLGEALTDLQVPRVYYLLYFTSNVAK